MTTMTVEEFFDNMCSQYFHKSMIRYINMASFRSEFIDQTYKLIEFTRNTFHTNNVNQLKDLSEELYDEVSKPIYQKIPFWFNETSNEFSDEYYISIFNFIETMANKQ